jgi:fucose permease
MNSTRQARADWHNLSRGIMRGLILTAITAWLLFVAASHFNF